MLSKTFIDTKSNNTLEFKYVPVIADIKTNCFGDVDV